VVAPLQDIPKVILNMLQEDEKEAMAKATN